MFLIGQYQIPEQTARSPEVTSMHKRTITKTSLAKVNTAANEVSVYSLIYKVMCSESQGIHKQTITRTRIFNHGFLWSDGYNMCSDVCWSQEWWGRDVNGFTESE